MSKIGLQLYSVKELCAEDFLGTLRKIGNAGYDGVEFAGFFGCSAEDVKKTLDEAGLVCAGSHTGINLLDEANFAETVAYNKAIGNNLIIVPGLPGNMTDSKESWLKTAEIFNKLGEALKAEGMILGYHNHAGEFKSFGGETGYDIFMANTCPDLIKIELDTFWVEAAGLSALDVMKKYSNRCPLLHIKEMKARDNIISTVIGEGVMDFKPLCDYGKEIGVLWYTVEQEEFDRDYLLAVEQDAKALAALLK